ncbi:hypothetical protein [Nonomuraea rubra]|uniref:hypothetical protein n=1 Tax=Nonomuraea rubra TaxID=46180 RepID=UPI0033E2AD46
MTDNPTPPPSEAERAHVEMLLAAYQRWETMQPIIIGLYRRDAYSLVCGMQLLLRHPDIAEPMREAFESFGRALQEQVADTPELYAMLESGWNPAADVPREGSVSSTDRTPGE